MLAVVKGGGGGGGGGVGSGLSLWKKGVGWEMGRLGHVQTF